MKNTTRRIQGVIVPIIAPLDRRGELDTTMVTLVVDYLVERGVSGLLSGDTGEGPLLTIEERRKLAEAVVRAADGRVPVIVHTAAMTTGQMLDLSLHAQAIGASAVAIIAPSCFHHSDEALHAHFEAAAAAVPGVPVYLHNNPAVTGRVLSLPLIRRLAEDCPNIIGLMDSSGNLSMLFACARLRQGNFGTASAPDSLILASLASGTDACVSSDANVVPELVVALYQALQQGDLAVARELQALLDAAHEALGDGNDLSLYKAMMECRGLRVGSVRRPLIQASDARIAQCWSALNELDLCRDSISLGKQPAGLHSVLS